MRHRASWAYKIGNDNICRDPDSVGIPFDINRDRCTKFEPDGIFGASYYQLQVLVTWQRDTRKRYKTVILSRVPRRFYEGFAGVVYRLPTFN